MGMYNCNGCDRLFDDDEVVCFEDPGNPLELICEDCHSNYNATDQPEEGENHARTETVSTET